MLIPVSVDYNTADHHNTKTCCTFPFFFLCHFNFFYTVDTLSTQTRDLHLLHGGDHCISPNQKTTKSVIYKVCVTKPEYYTEFCLCTVELGVCVRVCVCTPRRGILHTSNSERSREIAQHFWTSFQQICRRIWSHFGFALFPQQLNRNLMKLTISSLKSSINPASDAEITKLHCE